MEAEDMASEEVCQLFSSAVISAWDKVAHLGQSADYYQYSIKPIRTW